MGLLVRTGKLADFVGARGFGEGLRIFIRDAGEALRERAQRTHNSARKRPRECERERPERAQDRERPKPPESTRRRLDAKQQQAHLRIDLNPRAFPASQNPHFSGWKEHRVGECLAFRCRETLRGIRHRGQRVAAAPEIRFHPEHFAQCLRGALRGGQPLAADELRIGAGRRGEGAP